VKDPNAPPLWARFYEPSSGRPIFAGRDGVIRYSLEEIEKERTTGYQWYSQAGDRVLEEYARWKQSVNR
jgi:PelA/Pel-15E family pectate lyase